MDIVTQGLLGAAVAEAMGARERLGGRALAFGAACGVVPDLDALSLVGGYWSGLVHHRGCSHSLIVLAAVAPLLGLLACRWLGDGRARRLWIYLSFWALITHPLLDLFTSYGTQLLAPFSTARFALDGVGALDPLVTIPLAVAVTMARRASAARGRLVTSGALAWSVSYILVGATLSYTAARAHHASLTDAGFEPVAGRALITPGLPLLRRVVARDEIGNIAVALWSPWAGVARARQLSRPRDPAVASALGSSRGRTFRWFADGYVHAELTRDGDEALVRLSDQRFGLITEMTRSSTFRVDMRVGPDGRLRSVTPSPLPSPRLWRELAAGWRHSLGRATADAPGLASRGISRDRENNLVHKKSPGPVSLAP